MARLNSSNEFYEGRYRKPSFVMSTNELYALDRELETYRVTKFSSYWDRDISYIDTEKWMIEKKALRDDGAIRITNYLPAEYNERGVRTKPMDVDPIFFEELNEKLRQWIDWKGKKEYAQRKSAEELEIMAQAQKLAYTYAGLDHSQE